MTTKNQTVDKPNGYTAIFTSWNSFEWFDGTHYQTITLGDQISASLGAELQLLETFYLRYGMMTGAELWVRPHSAYGTEIDLFYLSFSISRVDYHSSELNWREHDSLTFVQTTIRIPIDGRPRGTFLSSIFGR